MTLTKNRLFCAAALSVVLSTPAFAGGPLAVCESGVPFRWENNGQNIPFNPDQGDLGPIAAADAVAFVESAFQIWEDIATANNTYQNAGQLPVDVDITNFGPFLNPVGPDGLSAIVFDDTGEIFDSLFGPGSGILGFAGPEFGDTATCEITEGVSFLNGPAFGDPTEALDVTFHEFGHYSNLAHLIVNGQQFIGVGDSSGPGDANTFGTPDPTGETIATMYPFYFGPTVGTRTPHLDDIASLSTLYPDPSFAATTGSISGTIFAPNGTTRLTGVNVIARNVANPFIDVISAISSDFTDGTDQSDPVVGTYTIEGLTPGAEYAVYVDEILAGGFSTTPLTPLPGPEEFFNGAGESNNQTSTDDPNVFTPIAIAAGVDVPNTDIIFNVPGEGDPLAVGDDGNVELFLPFAFTICGAEFESVFVNANGNLTFGAPSGDFSESAGEMLAGPPRIAGVWDDVNPSAGGSVFFTQSAGAFTVTWDNVPEFPATGSNTFSISLLRSNSRFEISYGNLSLEDGLTGFSCGGAITAGDEPEFDFSADRRRVLNTNRVTALYEQFTFGETNDLAQSIERFNGTFPNFSDFWAEPNDTQRRARRIFLPFDSRATNRLTEIEPAGGDVDFFDFRADEGTTVIAEIANAQFDTILGIFDSDGNQVAFDDDGGAGALSRIVFPVPADGKYALAVSSFGDADFSGDGVGGGGRYVLEVSEINGTLLSLGDDDSEEVALDFNFPFQGGSFGSVFVNSNGNLTFGSGDTDFSESVFELLNDQPRIAPLWDDLSPNQGGLVLVDSGPSHFSVTFDGVPEFFAATGNSFTVTLEDNGDISVSYGDVAAADGIAGVTEGGGAADPGETDLSAGGPFSANGTTYEQFGFGDEFDLDNTDLDYEN